MLGGRLVNKKLYIVGILLIIITPLFLNYNSISKEKSVDGLTKALEAKVPELLSKYDIPGAAISIIEEGQVNWVGTFGYANIDEEIKIERDTVFQAASISKPFTSIGIMKLVEEGRIHLDAPIQKYVTRWALPEAMYDKDQVTVRSLLSHTAGLSIGGGYQGYDPYKQLPTIEKSLSGIEGASRPLALIHEPGTKFRYSGGGYSLLQLLIEEVTARDYTDFMKTQVLGSIGMNKSSFQWEEYLRDKTAKAYDKDLKQIPNYLFVEKAAAGLYTTIDDMNKFMMAEIKSYNGDNKETVLSKKTMEEMFTPVLEFTGPQRFINPEPALGHFVKTKEDGSFTITHFGSNRGWKSNFTIIPSGEAAIAIFTNGDSGSYLLDEVLNSWHYTKFGEYEFIAKVLHAVRSTIYSLSSILMLWSVTILISLFKKRKKGIRQMTLLENKVTFIIKCFIITLILYGSYLCKVNLVGIFKFINPNIGNILAVALIIRGVVGIVQIAFVKSK